MNRDAHRMRNTSEVVPLDTDAAREVIYKMSMALDLPMNDTRVSV